MDPWEGRGAAWVSQGWWLGRSWGLEDVITLWTTKKYKAGEVKDVRVWFFFFSYGNAGTGGPWRIKSDTVKKVYKLYWSNTRTRTAHTHKQAHTTPVDGEEHLATRSTETRRNGSLIWGFCHSLLSIKEGVSLSPHLPW